jgi:hypothetical protein
MAVHTWNPSTQDAEAGVSPVQGQPGLHSKTLSHTHKKKICIPAFIPLSNFPQKADWFFFFTFQNPFRAELKRKINK